MAYQFQGTNPKYKNLTEQQRWIEYGRLKREYINSQGSYAAPEAYDAFIKKICQELDI